MAVKTANVTARIQPNIKEQAEAILDTITQSRTEQGTFLFKPAWLIKTTYISCTAAGVTDCDQSPKFI